jgi:hypothetical protein
MKNPDVRKIFTWEAAGAVFIVVLGAVFHYTHEWSGRSDLVAIFSAVNESVWEHLKLTVWPTLFFAAIEYFAWGKRAPNFWISKAIALLTMPVIIIGVFYSYTAIVGDPVLFVDISTFVVAVIMGQLLSYHLICLKALPQFMHFVAKGIVVIVPIIFAVFTFNPPQYFLFEESDPPVDIEVTQYICQALCD